MKAVPSTILIILLNFSSAFSLSINQPVDTVNRANCPIPTEFTPLPDPLPELKHTFYLLRHGQSTANLAGIISSNPEFAYTETHGLTPLGRKQSIESARSLIELLESNGDGTKDTSKPKKLKFVSSPFARAHQTAQGCIQGLLTNHADILKKLNLVVDEEIVLNNGLRERFFGRLDGLPLYTYAYVWPVDMFDPTHTGFEVESVSQVATRISESLVQIDNDIQDEDAIVILSSHADTLQITQVYAASSNSETSVSKNIGRFSQYRFANCEVRLMGRNEETLPEAKPLEPPKRGS